MRHLAFEIPSEDGTTEWCESVSERLYGDLI
jgi:4-carboxymuconolactone decarboxylase